MRPRLDSGTLVLIDLRLNAIRTNACIPNKIDKEINTVVVSWFVTLHDLVKIVIVALSVRRIRSRYSSNLRLPLVPIRK